mmetsp:Transcript_188/g.357  ORF Transcript_188/g.357 Transcript_188/m.357 type:complete len:217 (+) Transcript_188:366-1016(+)|eukprot:CAMPEP_0197472966 /NCGR_PEP_ID=MMETSP1309-20131121/4250_1 /TAXON_ID=464262 /ORGANISM="Genus nov. species nov., Strain RCC998" /LENGTH=216 /DNA_ID=CAMNT_0043011835 /DNA_START=328 /DNA_END=978 /DNA_ORIENTATION=+
MSKSVVRPVPLSPHALKKPVVPIAPKTKLVGSKSNESSSSEQTSVVVVGQPAATVSPKGNFEILHMNHSQVNMMNMYAMYYYQMLYYNQMNQMVQNVQQGAHVQAALRENFAASCSRPAREIERVRVRGRDERERDDGKKRRKGGKVAGKAECNAACSKKCSNCGTSTTPFWRKNKHGGLPLCNACGLYFSKNDAPRPKELWSTTAVEQQEAGSCN